MNSKPTFPTRPWFGAALAAALSLLVLPGCGSSTSAYIPNSATTRGALEGALATWQKGGKPDEFETAEPSVHFVDNQWTAGQVLEGFEILEENAGEAQTEKRYKVLLKLKPPEGEKHVEYIAVGRSPTWFFRDEDYVNQVGMGEVAKPKTRPRSRGR